MFVCRMCRSENLFNFLDLGFTPPADSFLRKDQLKVPETHYPLHVVMCEECGLAQLDHTVSPEVLYRHDYPYEASITETGRTHWAAFANSVVKKFALTQNDLVVDIGSNVGELLLNFKNKGTKICGVDPASNIVMIAQDRGVETICDFFNSETVDKIIESKGRASVITGTNVFAHIDNLFELMKNVVKLMTEKGVFVIEAPYLVKLLNNLEYDTVYHEHLLYLAVKPMKLFFSKFNLEIFDIDQADIHGGSFRTYVGFKGQRPVSKIVDEMLSSEVEQGIFSSAHLKEFSDAVSKNRQDLTWLIHSLKHEGKRIVAVSAPAKGMTLLNYCGFTTNQLEFVTEKSTLKIGRFTPGSHLPVVSDKKLIEVQPDYALLLAWNFADEIMKNLEEYRKKGGKFIIPIPTPRIVNSPLSLVVNNHKKFEKISKAS